MGDDETAEAIREAGEAGRREGQDSIDLRIEAGCTVTLEQRSATFARGEHTSYVLSLQRGGVGTSETAPPGVYLQGPMLIQIPRELYQALLTYQRNAALRATVTIVVEHQEP